MPELKIIDVSEHQGKIDWAEAKKHIDGAIIRTGYGDDLQSQDDKYAIYNMEMCKKYGIPFATYLYSHADSDKHIKSEIAHEKRLTQGKDVVARYLDCEERGCQEYWGRASKSWADAFPDAGAYSWQWGFEKHIKDDRLSKWICVYGTNSGKPESGFKPTMPCDGWQYTSKGYIPGIKGDVDISIWYVPFGSAEPKKHAAPERRAVTKKEVAALIMRHLCTHNAHGYTQNMERRQGTGEETIEIYGHKYTIPGGDRDCSSAVISAYEAAGISCGGATYTGNMCSCMLKTGNFKWRSMSFTAQMGDAYLNIKNHTAMCMSASPDILAEFSIDESGGVEGKKQGDQKQNGEYDETLGRGESHLAYYYNYPWDGILECVNDEIAFYVGGESSDSFPFPEKSDGELAVEVMFDKYGKSDVRRTALKDRYDAVQNKVTAYWSNMPIFISAVSEYLKKYGAEGLKKDG